MMFQPITETAIQDHDRHHDAVMKAHYDGIEQARIEIAEAMSREGRSEYTLDELRRLQPTPPNQTYESSASSVSSAEPAEQEEVAGPSKSSSLWIVKIPQRWADNRIVQIEQGLHVFYHAGIIHFDTVNRCVNWAGRMLAVVLSNPSAWEEHAMASSSYWTIHLCQIGFALGEGGDGFQVSSQSYEDMNEKKECLTMANMHKILLGDKSSRFKDFSKGGTYLTTVSSAAARKNKIQMWAMRGDERIKHLDIRPLGDELKQQRKTATFFQLWDEAGLPWDDDKHMNLIRERRAPLTHKFADPNTPKSQFSKKLMTNPTGLVAMKAMNRAVHGTKRASMGPVRGSDIKAALFRKPSASVVRMAELSEDEVDDDGRPIPSAKTAKASLRNCGAESSEATGPLDRAEAPSDDETDLLLKKVAILEAAAKAPADPVCDPETRNASSTPSEHGLTDAEDDHPSSSESDDSDSDSDEEMPDPDGPREEGGFSNPSDAIVNNLSMSDADKDKVNDAKAALSRQQLGKDLTKRELSLIAWLQKINFDSLVEGEIKFNPRKRQKTIEQLQKQRAKEAEARRRREAAELLRQAREALQVELRKQLDERTRERLQNNLLKLQGKEERKIARHQKRVERINLKMNNAIRKDRERQETRKRKYQELAAKKIEYARKRNMSAIVRTGDLSLKLLIRPKAEEEQEKELTEDDLVASSYTHKFQLDRRLAQRTGSISIGMPGPGGARDASTIRVRMKPRPGKREGTRASAAVAAMHDGKSFYVRYPGQGWTLKKTDGPDIELSWPKEQKPDNDTEQVERSEGE
jgi:DNA-binding protein YbaB